MTHDYPGRHWSYCAIHRIADMPSLPPGVIDRRPPQHTVDHSLFKVLLEVSTTTRTPLPRSMRHYAAHPTRTDFALRECEWPTTHHAPWPPPRLSVTTGSSFGDERHEKDLKRPSMNWTW